MRLTLLLVGLGIAAFAQLPPAGDAGVTMGHLHITTRDLDAQKKFWVDTIGASPYKLASLEGVSLPNGIILFRKGEHSGGTDGSVINHVGVLVRDLKAALDKVKANGFAVERVFEPQAFVWAPDGIRVEFTEDKNLATPVANHHIHWFNNDVPGTKAWYVKTFGAIPGHRGKFEAADLPGVNLTFAATDKPVAPTHGRALDHIGFEVTGLEAFCRKLEAQGIRMDLPYRKVPALGIAVAFFTDPWGAKVELTEGLRK